MWRHDRQHFRHVGSSWRRRLWQELWLGRQRNNRRSNRYKYWRCCWRPFGKRGWRGLARTGRHGLLLLLLKGPSCLHPCQSRNHRGLVVQLRSVRIVAVRLVVVLVAIVGGLWGLLLLLLLLLGLFLLPEGKKKLSLLFFIFKKREQAYFFFSRFWAFFSSCCWRAFSSASSSANS